MKKSYSIFEHYQRTGQLEFQEIVRRIKNGFTKSIQDQYRDALQQGLTSKAKALKEQLPAYTPSGNFSGERKKGAQLSYSQEVQVDIDKLSKQGKSIVDVKKSLATDPYTRSVFTSVGGDGLAASIGVNISKEDHESAFNQVAFYIERKYGVATDPSCKDITRLRFLPCDPDVLYNEASKCFEIIPPSIYDLLVEVEEFTKNKLVYEEGSRNSFIHLFACNANRKGIEEVYALKYALRYLKSNGIDDHEIMQTLESGYSHEEEFGSFSVAAAATAEARKLPELNTPYLPDDIIEKLPHLIREVECLSGNKRERDMLFLGMFAMLSSLFPKINGVHDKKTVSANLYLLISANAGAGKGRLTFIQQLAELIHEQLKRECKAKHQGHKKDCLECEKDKDCLSELTPPTCKGLFVPANSSQASLIKNLAAGEYNFMFDSEADLLGNTRTHEWSQLDPDLRKAFHHELVSSGRKEEDIEVKFPRLSMLITGTPAQCKRLADSKENGLVSRLCVYMFTADVKWQNQFQDPPEHIQDFMPRHQALVLDLFDYVRKNPFHFDFTAEQKQKHDDFFEKQTKALDGDEHFFASVKRQGLVVFRLAMILTCIRQWEEKSSVTNRTCHDIDFESALAITEVFIEHLKVFYHELSGAKSDDLDPILDKLSLEFTNLDFVEACKHKYKERAAYLLLSKLISCKAVIKLEKGRYRKIK